MNPQTLFSAKGLILGLIFPGAGHLATGQVGRGVLVAIGVLGLFFGGMFIGGIDVVDSEEDRVWFIGEALVGPLAFGVDAIHQNMFKAYDKNAVMGVSSLEELSRIPRRSGYPDEMRTEQEIHLGGNETIKIPVFVPAGPGQGPPNKKSLAKVNELGTLFSTIAGMMNLIAMIDAAFPGAEAPAGRGACNGPGGKGMIALLALLAAYRPFIDPIKADRWWYLLLVPLALGISTAYKAVRVPDLKDFPRQVAVMTVQIVVAMIALGAASYVFVQYVVPMIVPKS